MKSLFNLLFALQSAVSACPTAGWCRWGGNDSDDTPSGRRDGRAAVTVQLVNAKLILCGH
ncbi:hypothetical protein Pd630_LPD09014 (plasmid) [Rhodococcus opacus PD630]|nr:hypothetical protein Pd630_LPD09014 [Rhodococcus opacus PD630]